MSIIGIRFGWLIAVIAALTTLAVPSILPLKADTAAELTLSDFAITVGEREYALGKPAAPLVEAVESAGYPIKMTQSDSCLFRGMDREFSGGAILLSTYPIGPGGGDQLESILITGGIWKTPRGVGAGDSVSRVREAYGVETLLDYDQLIYSRGDPIDSPFIVFTLDMDTHTVAAILLFWNTQGY